MKAADGEGTQGSSSPSWYFLSFVVVSLSAAWVMSLPCFGSEAQQAGTAVHLSFAQISQAADRARDENRDDDAIRLYKQALTKKPDWEQGLWYLATLLYEKEQYAAARDTFRQFMTLRPDAGPGWALLGISEFQTREYPRALDHLQNAMSRGMGDRKDLIQSVFYYVVVLLTRLERYDEATCTWGHWPNAWRWEQVRGPDLCCSEVASLVESIDLSQPGQGDDGQPWE